MPEDMVWFEKNSVRFFLCSRGIVINGGRVLLFNVIGKDWWALPGGRVEMLENSKDTLQREIKEELNSDAEVGRLVWIIENFFTDTGQQYHELGMYYLTGLPRHSPILSSDAHTCADGPVNLRFKWFPVLELEAVNLRPLFLKKALQHLPDHIEHVIWHDD